MIGYFDRFSFTFISIDYFTIIQRDNSVQIIICLKYLQLFLI